MKGLNNVCELVVLLSDIIWGGIRMFKYYNNLIR